MTSYFDCNATAPLDPRARAAILHHLDVEFGNEGSRTHEYGANAKRAVHQARIAIANILDARSDEVIFTSGATESNNLAILGLERHGEAVGRRHIVTTAIEHKAVLEPCEALEKRGFEITYVSAGPNGRVSVEDVLTSVRDDTLLVSIMHVNNETGIIQPIAEIAEGLQNAPAFFHVDAAQGFGKQLTALRHPRVQLVSISAHKIYGPKGIGALVARRGRERLPLTPLLFGGGQERGLRPGTLPVHLIAGFGAATAAAAEDWEDRAIACQAIKARVLGAFAPLGAIENGDRDHCLPSTVNLSVPGLDSEAVMLALKDLIAISNGSACTSSSYEPSHVLKAMGFSQDRIEGALRLSWCHDSIEPNWLEVTQRLENLL